MGDVVPLGAQTAQGGSAVTPSLSHPSLPPLGADARIVIERTTSGRFSVTSPDAPGWMASVADRLALLRAVDEGFRHAAMAAYARERGQPDELVLHDRAAAEAAMAGQVLPFDPDERASALASLACGAPQPAVLSTRQSPSDVHNPLAWTPLADGRWLAPSGKKWGADTRAVQAVKAKRAAMGVDTP